MAQINYIRYEVNQKGDSYASVARRMGIDVTARIDSTGGGADVFLDH